MNCFNNFMRELQASITHENVPVLQYLPHINALLERAVTVCRVAEEETTTTSGIQALVKKEKIAPGENKELQWRFRQTTKPPGRKKCGLVLRYFITILASS